VKKGHPGVGAQFCAIRQGRGEGAVDQNTGGEGMVGMLVQMKENRVKRRPKNFKKRGALHVKGNLMKKAIGG